MAAIDKLNRDFGSGTIKLGAEGLSTDWRMKQEKKSPCYTTRVGDRATALRPATTHRSCLISACLPYHLYCRRRRGLARILYAVLLAVRSRFGLHIRRIGTRSRLR
jgi:hypothetical protein